MRLEIKLQKSIDNLREIPMSKWTYYSDFIFFGLSGLVFLFLIVFNFFENHFSFDFLTVLGIIIYVVIYSLVLPYIYKMDKFKIFNDNKGLITKDVFIVLANKLQWKILDNDGNLMIFQPPGSFSNDSQVTIIFFNRNILINVMTFGRSQVKSPIYFLYDKSVYKDIFDTLNNIYNDKTIK